jgi:hypothetical protein
MLLNNHLKNYMKADAENYLQSDFKTEIVELKETYRSIELKKKDLSAEEQKI